MIESMPWPAQIGVAAGGYVAFVSVGLWVIRAFIKGDLFPRRTVEQLERRNEVQEHTIAEQNSTIATLTKSTALANAVMENLNRAANEVTDP